MKTLKLFLWFTFIFFVVGFGITGALVFTKSPNYLVVIVQILMAWTPTMAFAIIHRRIDPDKSLWRSIADRFATPIKLLPFLASIFIPVAAITIVWIAYSVVSHEPLFDLVAKLSAGSIFLIFLDGFIRGPLGEELGWRGYLQIEFNKHYSLLKSSLFVGVIWGAWHFPLWFVSGFQGANLLLYIVFFMIGLVAFSVIIGYIYGRGGNLLYPILLHQMLNFSGRLINVDELIVLGGSSAVYIVMALIIAVTSLKPIRNEVATQ